MQLSATIARQRQRLARRARGMQSLRAIRERVGVSAELAASPAALLRVLTSAQDRLERLAHWRHEVEALEAAVSAFVSQADTSTPAAVRAMRLARLCAAIAERQTDTTQADAFDALAADRRQARAIIEGDLQAETPAWRTWSIACLVGVTLAAPIWLSGSPDRLWLALLVAAAGAALFTYGAWRSRQRQSALRARQEAELNRLYSEGSEAAARALEIRRRAQATLARIEEERAALGLPATPDDDLGDWQARAEAELSHEAAATTTNRAGLLRSLEGARWALEEERRRWDAWRGRAGLREDIDLAVLRLCVEAATEVDRLDREIHEWEELARSEMTRRGDRVRLEGEPLVVAFEEQLRGGGAIAANETVAHG